MTRLLFSKMLKMTYRGAVRADDPLTGSNGDPDHSYFRMADKNEAAGAAVAAVVAADPVWWWG
jgi:hypothetical protein